MHVLAETADPLEPKTEDGSPEKEEEEQTPDETEPFGIPLLGFRKRKTTCNNTQDESGEDETAAEPKKDGSVA